jgi:short-subunit dehydrogenase
MKKIVLITGTSKGIGKALAAKMLKENYFVIGTSREGTVKEIKTEAFYPLKLDLTIPTSIREAQKEITENFSSIDILINKPGIGPDLDTLKPKMNSFQQKFHVNVEGTVFLPKVLFL